MTAQVRSVDLGELSRSSGLIGRVWGEGSIFDKALRDARLAIIVVGALVGLVVLALGSFFDTAYASNRQQLTDVVTTLPAAAKGIFWGSGDMSAFNTLGGYVSIDAQFLYKLVPGLWSILALSAALATETRRGSLEFVAAGPTTRRLIALQKVAAHLVAITAISAVVGVLTWLTGQAFAKAPADAISVSAAIGWAAWIGVMGLVAGSIAFALSPLLGRAAAAGVAGVVMFGAYVVDGFRGWIPAFDALGGLSWFSATAGFNPLAGQWDWSSLAIVAAVATGLFAVGVEAFARLDLDLGGRNAVGVPGVPQFEFWVRGPIARALGELLPGALSWGIGLGVYGLIIAASSRSFADSLAAAPQLMTALRSLFPDYDLATAGGLLQGAFLALAFVIVGLASAALVSAWAADETSGRLELILAAPLSRARWALAGGAGVLMGIAVTTLVAALAIAIGVVAAGGEVVAPVVGTFALGLYAAALAGVGFAVGGLVSARAAGISVAVLAVASFLTDFLVPALNLPAWLRQLALSADFGQPMVGRWETSGIMVAVALALGGIAVGAWAMKRRDVAR